MGLGRDNREQATHRRKQPVEDPAAMGLGRDNREQAASIGYGYRHPLPRWGSVVITENSPLVGGSWPADWSAAMGLGRDNREQGSLESYRMTCRDGVCVERWHRCGSCVPMSLLSCGWVCPLAWGRALQRELLGISALDMVLQGTRVTGCEVGSRRVVCLVVLASGHSAMRLDHSLML